MIDIHPLKSSLTIPQVREFSSYHVLSRSIKAFILPVTPYLPTVSPCRAAELIFSALRL